MELTLDMETRSSVSLKDCGLYVYAEGEATDIMCIAVKIDDQLAKIWVPEKFRRLGPTELSNHELEALVQDADKIHAHNATFERILWQHIMEGRYAFLRIPFDVWRCTAAKSVSFALPRALHYVCEALDLPQKKDNIGYRIMMKMCKPNAKGKWHENKKDFVILCDYCKQDTEAEYTLNQTLPDLSPYELMVWQMDQRINDRGIKVDVDAIDNLIYKVQAREKQLLMEVQEITGGAIKSTRQRDATLKWLKGEGVELPDLTKLTVTRILKEKIPDNVRKLLEIRQTLSKSSVSKFQAMKRRACKDGRIKGTLLYYGGHTGRWAGQGIQPQNFPRESYESNDIRKILLMGVDELETKYGCTFVQASKCLRGMIMAEPGKNLLTSDFASIEAVVLAWIACEADVLQAFRDGLDAYKVAATSVYHKKYEDINDKQRFIGKTIVLACGYQGWTNAFRRALDQAEAKGEYDPETDPLSDEEIAGHIGRWREGRVSTTNFWAGVMEAAIKTVKTGDTYSYGMVKFGMRGKFLHCRLPSSRLLSYYDPAVEMHVDQWHREREIITYMGVDPYTKKWARLTTYGGKLTENIVQAISRDILVDAMLQMDLLGYDIVMHVHDEIVAEGVEDSVEEMEKIMSTTPKWAFGCPIGAKGWVDERYKKV